MPTDLSSQPLRAVTGAERRAYEEDGVVHLPGIVDAGWLAFGMAAIEDLLGNPTAQCKELADGQGRHLIAKFMWNTDERFRAMALASPLPRIAAEVLGADQIRFFYDQLFVKEPLTPSETDWHQDLPFFPFAGNDVISLWLAFTPVTRESSGVEYLAGSHRWDVLYRPGFADKRESMMDHAECPNYSKRRGDEDLRFLSWNLEPGDIVAHHPRTIHGASGNLSATQRRIGLSNRYLGPDVRWDPRPGAPRYKLRPEIRPGDYPADDRWFPVCYQRAIS